MTRIRLGLEWFLNPDHVPFLIAQDRGWFADAGLDVEIIEPAEHLDAVEAIEKGEMDVAITEPLHLVEDRAAGRPCIGFARFLHTNGGVMARSSCVMKSATMSCAGVSIEVGPASTWARA